MALLAAVQRELVLLLDHGHMITFLPAVLAAAFGFLLLHLLAGAASRALLPGVYNALPHAKRIDWDVRIVSMLFATFITLFAFFALDHPDIAADPVFTYHPITAAMSTIATGYFLWDLGVCLYHFDVYGWPFFIHGFVCFLIYLFSLRPILTRFAAVFLLFEASTIPLNINWFLDFSPYANGKFRILNGLVLVLTFFFVRIVYGLYQSYEYYIAVYYAWDRMPKTLVLFYSLGNVILNSLNLFWFRKLIAKAARTLKKSKAPPAVSNGAVGGATPKKQA